MRPAAAQPSYRSSRVRRWVTRLWGKGIRENWRPATPTANQPVPELWSNEAVTASWLGHATVLINFFGVTILTDPVFFARIGVRIPFLCTIGPKRLIAPPLPIAKLPRIDLILLSHAHFDHTDLLTLRHFDRRTQVVTAERTRGLLRWTRLRDIAELRWDQSRSFALPGGSIKITALPVKHWGARLHFDNRRGYNAYLLERNGRRILFAGDTAMTDQLAHGFGPIDLALMPIGCYDPWIATHCTPEQAVQMAELAGARYIMPVHHQTFRLSFEPAGEPIERFVVALEKSPERIALREIGQTFVLPA